MVEAPITRAGSPIQSASTCSLTMVFWMEQAVRTRSRRQSAEANAVSLSLALVARIR